MLSAELRAALSAHLEAVAAHLQADLDHGAEVPFELEQHGGHRGGRRPALYCYRPLTSQFMAEREVALESLPTFRDALHALEGYAGLERYLLSAGIELDEAAGAGRARMALWALMETVFSEQSEFELRPERLRTALARLDSALGSGASDVTVLATLHGLAIASHELLLASGLRIARADAVTGLPAAALAGSPGAQGEDGGGSEHLVVILGVQDEEPLRAIARSRAALGELLRALRLFGDGRLALGRLAWVRVGDGAWHPCPLGEGGRPHGMLLVTAEQEDELRAFCNLVSRRAPHGDSLAWALRRFELGCERADPLEGLSDHLMALRALLDVHEDSTGALARRLSALCATADQREELHARVEQALELERGVRAGRAGAGSAAAEALAGEIADHLRALLRDVICGHLQPQLAALADELTGFEEPAADIPQQGSDATDERTLRTVRAEHAEEPRHALSSLEEIFSDPRQAEEILDVLI